MGRAEGVEYLDQLLAGRVLVPGSVAADDFQHVKQPTSEVGVANVPLFVEGFRLGAGFFGRNRLIGSIAERIVRLAHCPVLVLRD